MASSKGAVAQMPEYFPEEERSKQPTIFSVLRTLVAQMRAEGENHLGFYGALGYDLVLQFRAAPTAPPAPRGPARSAPLFARRTGCRRPPQGAGTALPL